jgi:hypothetical protein
MTITTKLLDKIGFIRNNRLISKKSTNLFPDFLGIGAQKSGTTWLYENLRIHSQLYLPKTKEIHFFDWYFYKSINWYYKHFENAEISQVKGEITPSYSILSEDKIRLIHAINPRLKIILLLRNPIERTWSQAVMNLVKNNEGNTNFPITDLYSIKQLLKGKRKKNIHLIKNEEFIAHFNQKSSIERGNYLKIIRKWGEYFPSNQIFIGDYNQLKNSPQKLLNEVFNFLEVKQITDWNGYPVEKTINKTVNKNKKIPDQLHEYLLNLYSNDLKALRTKIPNIKW